jgi:hypothetical protein
MPDPGKVQGRKRAKTMNFEFSDELIPVAMKMF